jgi:hypothetical protein
VLRLTNQFIGRPELHRCNANLEMNSSYGLFKSVKSAYSFIRSITTRDTQSPSALTASSQLLGYSASWSDCAPSQVESQRSIANFRTNPCARAPDIAHGSIRLSDVGAASFTPYLGYQPWRGHSAHAAIQEKDTKHENPGFVAGKFDVQQFPPERVGLNLPRLLTLHDSLH